MGSLPIRDSADDPAAWGRQDAAVWDGFSAFLLATGVLTLRTGVLSRWTGFVALLGAGCFAITLLTTLNNSGDGSAFGYAFFPAMLSFVVWTVATSLTRYRTLTR
jgi:hypothetical protein